MQVALVFLNLLAAGLLAGEEVAIRYGVRGPLASLEPRAHIEFRQALIRTLRILVPLVFAATLLSGVAAAVAGGVGAGLWLRVGGLLALGLFMAVTLTGTVPINKAALAWDPASPPAQWSDAVARWERLDDIRTWAALAAFALFLAAATLR